MKVPKAKQLPSGNWFIHLRLGGENIPVTARTERECTKQAQLVKAEYLAGKRAQPEPEAPKLPTLGEGCEQYINDNQYAMSPATVRGYWMIRNNRFPELMAMSMSDITKEDSVAALTAAKKKYAPKTIKSAWSFVCTVLRYYKLTPPDVPMPQVPKNKRAFLDSSQIKVFIQAVKGNPYELPILLALTSMRRSEIMALRWENIDLDKGYIHVSGAAVMDKDNKLVQKPQNKNDTSDRYIPIMIPELREALEAAQKPSGLVVTCNPNTPWANARRVCRRAGLPPVGLHGLRHSFASLSVSLNVPEEITMTIGGWSDIQTMRKIYTHISQTDMTKYEGVYSGFYTPKNANENANDENQ